MAEQLHAEQLHLEVYTATDALRWLGFPPTTPDDVARVRFAQRFGYYPERVLAVPNLKLVGPLRGGAA